jgi:hypothetical protein
VQAGPGADLVSDGGERFLAPISRFPGAAIGFNPQDRFMMGVGRTLVVVTGGGNVFGAGLRSVPTPAHLGIGHNGRPYGRVYEREVLPVAQFSGPKIGSSPADRFMMAAGQQLVVVRGDGDVFGSVAQGTSLGPVVQLNVTEPHLSVGTARNAIQVELELRGRSFTPGGTCTVVVDNVPGFPRIEHSHFQISATGEWYWPQTFQYRTVSPDLQLPPIMVTATDEATGRSDSGSTSAEPYVVRFP